MGQMPVRARILHAFTEREPITREVALDRAKVEDRKNAMHEFRHLLDGAYIETTQWRVNWPREYLITPRGIDKREHNRAVETLIHG